MWWSLGWVVKQSSGGRRPGAWVWAPRAGFHFWKFCNWTIGVIRNICVMHKSSIQANMFMVLIPSQLTSIQLLEFFPVQKSLLLLLSLPVALSEPVNVNASRLMFLMPAKKDAWPCLPFIWWTLCGRMSHSWFSSGITPLLWTVSYVQLDIEVQAIIACTLSWEQNSASNPSSATAAIVRHIVLLCQLRRLCLKSFLQTSETNVSGGWHGSEMGWRILRSGQYGHCSDCAHHFYQLG